MNYKKYILFFIMTIVFIGPIGQFILFRFTPVYDLNLFSKLYDDAFWVKGRPKIVIMGSSHARYHIIPAEIAKMNRGYGREDIVNIGENAASPFEMYTTLMKNKEKFSEVETVYYTLEPHILGEKYYLYNKYEKIFLNYDQWKYLEEKHGRKNSYMFPFQIFIDSLQFKTNDRSKSNGYSALRHKEFNTFSTGKVRKLIYEPLSLFPVSSYEIKYLKKIKNMFEKQGTKFIFVLTPTYSWQKFYANEGKPFDDMLISMLNEALGESVVIGSFWADDFDLKYQDFKDDTHLAHSGAVTFTRALFHDIESQRHLKESKFKNTFSYRFEKSVKPEMRLFKVIRPQELKWSHSDKATLVRLEDGIRFSESEIRKYALLQAGFDDIINAEQIVFKMRLPVEKLKMISITLRSNNEFGHFFINPSDFNNGDISLSSVDVSEYSKGFDFKNVNQLAIRLYPSDETAINDFRLNVVEFLY